MVKEEIGFEEFVEISNKLHIQIGRVVAAERIEGVDKLIKLSISFDDNILIDLDKIKVCVTNLGGTFTLSDFVGKVFPFVMNLKPVKLRGVLSEVMIMPSEYNGGVELGIENFSVGGKLL